MTPHNESRREQKKGTMMGKKTGTENRNDKTGVFSVPFLTLVLAAGLLYFMTEVGALESTFWNSVSPLSWIPEWVLVNGFTYLALICAVSLIMPRYSISILVLTVLFAAMAVVNHYMFRMHGSLFTLVDIYNVFTAVNVAGSYHFGFDKYIAMILFVALLLFALSARLFRRKETDRTHTRKKVITHLILFVLPVYFLYFSVLSPLASLRDSWIWHWDILYATYGFLPPVIVNAIKGLNTIIEPEGYAAYKLSGLPDVDNTNAVPMDEYPDILIILNESWYDLEQFTTVNSDVDYLENYHHLENAVTGYAVIPGYTGGTNNSEYEFLTSNSVNLLAQGTPFFSLDMTNAHSVVDYLKALGYETGAGHPAASNNYHRGTVYPLLGFDHSWVESEFKPLETYHGYCSDVHAVRTMLDLMNGMDRNRPHFGYLLTLQNHGDWINLDEEEMSVSVTPPYSYDDRTISRIREYVSCMIETDYSILYLTQRLAEQYEKTGRRTIVCMVGDHAPTLIIDLQTELEGPEKSIAEHITPFFIWANYPIDTALVGNTDLVDICDLVPVLLKTAGMPMSAYYEHIVKMVNAGISAHTDIFITGKEGMASHQGDYATEIESTGEIYLNDNEELQFLTDGSEQSAMVRMYSWLEYNNLDRKTRMDELFFPQ